MTSNEPSRYRLVESVVTDEGVQVDFAIRPAEGPDAKHLALEQARALREVMAWLTDPRQSDSGQDRAA